MLHATPVVLSDSTSSRGGTLFIVWLRMSSGWIAGWKFLYGLSTCRFMLDPDLFEIYISHGIAPKILHPGFDQST